MRDSEGKPLDLSGFSSVNIRNLSIKCGNCESYQTMAGFAQGRDWNVYTFECENGVCAPAVTRTLVEVPRELDEYATRDPEWHGGKRHAGSGHDS